ncbi:MAG: response regulator [Planctomycetota bacterium]
MTRKIGQCISFPELGIEIQLCRTSKRGGSLGIWAPQSVRVVRSELADKLQPSPGNEEAVHSLRNALNTVLLTINTIERRLEQQQPVDRTLISRAIEDLSAIESEFTRQREKADAPKLSEENSKAAEAAISMRKFVEAATASARSNREDGTAPKQARCRAMLVEDNRNEMSLMAAILRSEGIEVVTAIDGESAVTYLRSGMPRPDVILMDMNLPGMSGSDVIREIRADDTLRSIRMYGVSGSSPDEAGVTVGGEGVDRWFQKPVEPAKLVAAIS